MHADENRLKQVIYNLIGNAVKFTDSGAVTVSARRRGNQLEICVEDTGIGIPPAEQDRIFTAFQQADGSGGPNRDGTGLGLPISANLLRLMGGKLYLDWSEPGQGSRFIFRLAAAEAAADQPVPIPIHEQLVQVETAAGSAAAAQEVSGAGAFTLLAVDDEPSNLQVLANLFADKDYRLLTTTNAQEALRLVRSPGKIDLVLLDVMMPKRSGYEVCREIRKHYSLFDLPIVLLTVRNTPSDIAAGFDAGANDFIVKPFDPWEVKARVGTLLQLKSSVRDALAAEMAFLQSQIKPHFLFNALNAIIAFCRTDSSRAEHLLLQLSQYLRKSFDIPGTETFVRLEEELQLLESYVAIEQARFDERLRMEYDVDPALYDVNLLPLTIQPLVENAIRHGVMKREEGGTVRLTVKSVGSKVYVEVWDNGGSIPAERIALLKNVKEKRRSSGVGLANIHRRQLNFFGEGLRIECAPNEWTKVSFCFKYEPLA